MVGGAFRVGFGVVLVFDQLERRQDDWATIGFGELEQSFQIDHDFAA
jgi:hypothetical protein